MIFWLKFFHIAAMAVWFTGLFLLPRLFIASREADVDHAHLNAMGKTLYFGLTTPAAAITVALGIVLMAFGFQGAWLPAKLALVTLAVLLHVYFGQLLLDLSRGHARHGPMFYRVLNWCPLLLLLGIVALAAGQPGVLPLLGGV
ncbi:MAG: CopD family protein [Gammaproteobacteria bacterium]|nr:CopD family protein [Gammaproteobacteria bacterium]